jgi:hypothetical protein
MSKTGHASTAAHRQATGRPRCLIAGTLTWLTAVPTPSRAQDSDQVRYYLGLRVGETNPLINAKDLIGFSLGVNLGLHVGVELSVR